MQMVPAITVAVIILYLPGYLALRAARLPREWALASAPPITLAALTLTGELLSRLGVAATPATLLLPITAIPGVLAVVLRDRREVDLPPLSWTAMLLSVVVGLTVGNFFWAEIMPTSTSVYQIYDVVHHLAHVRTYLNTQRFTFFSDFYYPIPRDDAMNPWPSSGFYPSAWHMACAATVQVSGAHMVTAYHGVNLVFCGVVFPLAVQCLVAHIFRGHTVAQVMSALAASSVAAFPWGLMGWGPVISQLAAFTLVPIVIWLFSQTIEPGATRPNRIRFGVLFLASLIGTALAQPNAAFAVALYLIPRTTVGIWRTIPKRFSSPTQVPDGFFSAASEQDDPASDAGNPYRNRRLKRAASANPYKRRLGFNVFRLLAVLFAILAVVVWCVLPFSPQLENIATFHWAKYAELPDAIWRVLTLDYVDGFVGLPYAAQPALAIVLLVGVVRTLVERKYRWASVSYLVVACIMVVCIYDETSLRSALAGYWYTDPYRVASMCAIFGVPLVAFGLAWPIELVGTMSGAKFAATEYVFSPKRLARIEMAAELAEGEGGFAEGADQAGFADVYAEAGFDDFSEFEVLDDNPYREAARSSEPERNPYLPERRASSLRPLFSSYKGGGLVASLLMGFTVAFAFTTLIYVGDQMLPGVIAQSAFSVVRETYQGYFELNAPYSQEEDAFLQRVRDEVGTDAVILNDPYDGSLFGYPLYNLRLTYRFNDGYIPGGEKLESIDVRHRAHLYTQNELVADDLRALGIEYVLQLDNKEHGIIFGPSDDYQMTFQGIRNVTDGTPGFSLVLHEGDRKLYKVTML